MWVRRNAKIRKHCGVTLPTTPEALGEGTLKLTVATKGVGPTKSPRRPYSQACLTSLKKMIIIKANSLSILNFS